jgi:hypothetical protein
MLAAALGLCDWSAVGGKRIYEDRDPLASWSTR